MRVTPGAKRLPQIRQRGDGLDRWLSAVAMDERNGTGWDGAIGTSLNANSGKPGVSRVASGPESVAAGHGVSPRPRRARPTIASAARHAPERGGRRPNDLRRAAGLPPYLTVYIHRRLWTTVDKWDEFHVAVALRSRYLRFTSLIMKSALTKRVPVAWHQRHGAEEGALGTPPGALPRREPTRFRLTVPLRTACWRAA